MMKSFFKKLAFVMALAMVVSMVAPAGSALAAETGVAHQVSKEVVTTYEFEKAGDTVDFCFLGAPKDWKTTFKWTSDNEAVATVDKAGVVTAVAGGTATITITAGADASYKETVVVTVPAAIDFEIAQVDTVTATLTFNEGADLSTVTVEDFAVTAIDESFEYTLFANTAEVKDNVVTLTFVEGVLTDGAVIKVGYKDVEKTLVASNGEVAKVVVSYGMNDKYTGDAYVYTDLDPDYVLLTYKLYDANGIDVTANFEENVDYTIEWALTSGADVASEPEEGDKGWQMSFDQKGAATVKTIVTFLDEDGEERPVESAATPIVAKDRPAIAFTFEEAGVTDAVYKKDNQKAVVNSFNNPWGTFWGTDMFKSSVQKGKSVWFAARLTDNRGNGVVTTKLTYDGTSDMKAKGDTGCGEDGKYGYFVYESSNEDILDIDDFGVVTGVEVGTATILVSFVRYNEDGEEMDPVKVCSKRISVTTDYPEPYAKSFEFIKDSVTLTSTGYSVETDWGGNDIQLRIYDQYGRAFNAGDISNAVNVTVPSTYEGAEALFDVTTATSPDFAGYAPVYLIHFNGAELSEYADIKDNSYTTFKFTVEFDKDLEDFSKMITKNDKASVKVYNVDKYYEELTKFYSATAPAITASADTAFKKWNWSAHVDYRGNSADTYVDTRTEFDSNTWTGNTSTRAIVVDLNSATGLKLMEIPATHFIKLTEKVDTINAIKDPAKRNLVEGAIYYQVNIPSKADNYVANETNKVTFTFNDVNETTKLVEAATTGTYSVSMYYVNSQNKLVKLTNGVQNINVTNSTPAVKAEGFKETNVYEGTLTTEAEIIAALEKMYNFSWNGELLYDENRNNGNNGFSYNFEILDIPYDSQNNKENFEVSTDKVVIKKITFKIGYFNECAKDNNGGVTNNPDGYYQEYTLNKRITIKLDNK